MQMNSFHGKMSNVRDEKKPRIYKRAIEENNTHAQKKKEKWKNSSQHIITKKIHTTFTHLRTVVLTALKIRKNLIYVHFKCWLILIPFSQYSPSNPWEHKHRYPLRVNPDWQVALFWHLEFLSQAFWRRNKVK